MTVADRDPAATPTSDCATGCPHCTMDRILQPPSDEVLTGWSFASASALYFLTPLIMAFVGAALGRGQLEQFIGAAVGLGVGMAVTSWFATRRRATKETAWQQR
jgi:hypothetical protein